MVDFSNVINEINKLSGVKSIARKFDSSERIWVRVKSSSGATTSIIYCYNLSGTKIASSGTITTAKGNHDQFFAMDDKCWIYTNTATAPIWVYQIQGTSINKISQTNNIGSWPTSVGFAWKQGSDIHFSTSTNGSVETPIDCNITTGTVTRIEKSGQRVIAQYFHYTGSGFEGVLWNHSNSTTKYHTRYKFETTTSGAKDMTSSSVLEDGYYCTFIPTFYYTNSLSDIPYELFAMTYNPSTSTTESNKWTNLGICNDVRILRGTIVIPNISNSFQITKWGLLHDGNNYYSYNASSGNIELINTVGNKIATKQEAVNISGVGNYGSEGNKAILRSEIDSFGCELVQGVTYNPEQCVKLSDLVKMNIGFTINSTIEYMGSYVSQISASFGVDFGYYLNGNFILATDNGFQVPSPFNGSSNSATQTTIISESSRKDIVNNCTHISISGSGEIVADIGQGSIIIQFANYSRNIPLGSPISTNGNKATYRFSDRVEIPFSPSKGQTYNLYIGIYTSA